MVAVREQKFVIDALDRLAGALDSLSFGPDATALAAEGDRLARTLRSYLIPRALDPSTPMTVVLAGPTGSGKSTLINSLTGLDGSKAGPLRPTTRVPVVIVDADRAGSFDVWGDVHCRVVEAKSPILEGMVLVDTPDIDSTSTSHRAIAENLIDNADVVVFVMSALRYADEVPWQVLRRAESRGTTVIHVLNRLGTESAGAIVDFRSRLAAEGRDDDLITVSEHHLRPGAERLPELAIRSLRNRLNGALARRETSENEIFARVLGATVTQVSALARAVTDLQDDVAGFQAEVSDSLAGRATRLELDGLGSATYPEPPPASSRLARRRWIRRSDVDRVYMSVAEREIGDRLVAVVEEDIRDWLVSVRPVLVERRLDPLPLMAEAVAAARAAAEGWMSFVARIAADLDVGQLYLGQAVLLDAATRAESIPAVDLLFGDDGTVLAERARRELVNRVQMLYDLVADLVTQSLRERYGDLEDDELRASLGAVTSSLAPVYA